MRFALFFGPIGLFATIFVEAACSSSNDQIVALADASSEAAAEDSGALDAGPDGDRACTAASGVDSCDDCCGAFHDAGATVFLRTLKACRCAAAPDGCATECADSYCAKSSTEASEACRACFTARANDEGFCGLELQESCFPMADCFRYNRCLLHCRGK